MHYLFHYFRKVTTGKLEKSKHYEAADVSIMLHTVVYTTWS